MSAAGVIPINLSIIARLRAESWFDATTDLPRPRTPQTISCHRRGRVDGATLRVGTIDLKGNAWLTELVYECVGLAFKSQFGKQNPPKDIRVNETTFCRLLDNEKSRSDS